MSNRPALRNRLAHQPSPYLRQHADHPVDWYPWGPEALERARREDRPLLLSIGYAACHWCHVMAHESFSDPAIARLMNDHFVNVKVDREERPDLDHVYQLAHQLLTGRGGGWPLTLFLTPDGRPFFAGTYFPPVPRHGLPGFPELLRRVAAHYRDHRDDAVRLGDELTRALDRVAAPSGDAAAEPSFQPLDDARFELERDYDPVHGGFGGAPKFPRAPDLQRLLALLGGRFDDRRAREMLHHTLLGMARGGIHDLLGGGFHRYSVDERWRVPHFEKMLYDNALLLAVYADAWRALGDPRLRAAAEATAAWMLRELRAPGGAFYASLDADSPGGEGAFYTWSEAELREAAGPDDFELARLRFGLGALGEADGRHVLRLAADPGELAARLGIPPAAAADRLERLEARLREARERRPRPARDDKILTAWNALAIRGLARAGRLLDRPDLVDAAVEALDFLRAELWSGGRLRAAWGPDGARLDAYLDDHAYLLEALLELLQSRWRPEDLAWAVQLAQRLIGEFEDRDAGGFFFTGAGHETLIHRFKSGLDGAQPSGNGVAASALLRLGHLLGESRWLEAAERTLRAFGPVLQRAPLGHAALLDALQERLEPGEVIVLRGRPEVREAWAARCREGHHPRRLVLSLPDGPPLPEALECRRSCGEATAYLCVGTHCTAPLTSLEALLGALRCTSPAPESEGHATSVGSGPA